jgi:hypothetical protein
MTDNGIRIVYMVGHYRAATIYQISLNIQRAREVAAQVWLAGFMPVCPHLNSAFLDGLVGDDVILARYHELLLRCDAVCAFDDWRKSDGSRDEVFLALREGIPVYASLQDLLGGRPSPDPFSRVYVQ